jgi:hypothetical protein
MKKNIWLSVVFCFVAVWLGGCDIFSTTSISKILQNPRDYAGKEVQVSGTVVEVFSIMIIKYFVIKEDTSKLVIVTDRAMPKIGEKVKVKGKIEEAFSLGDQQMMVLIENSGR